MSPLVITLIVLCATIVLLLSERVRPDLVGLMAMVGLGLSGVLTQAETFSGFSRSSVMTILAIFMVAEGLMRAGVADYVGGLLLTVAGASEQRMVVAVMLGGACLSLFMNNIAAASVLLPAVAGAAGRAGVRPSRLLMPLAFGTILGGMATLFTTTNIVASGLLTDAGQAGFGPLSFAPLGLPLVVAGIAYMTLWGVHLLPRRTSLERQAVVEEAQADLVRLYRLGEKLFRARIPAGSRLHGRRLSELGWRDRYNCSVLAIEREPAALISPFPDVDLAEGDVLIVKGDLEEFRRCDTEPFFEILPSPAWTEERLSAPEDVVVEAMLAPRSTLFGRTIRGVHFRARYGFNVLAIWRAGEQLRVGVRDVPMELGDALLLQGPRSHLAVLRKETDFILMVEDGALEAAVPMPPLQRAAALLLFAASVVGAALMPDRVGEIFLAAAVGMLLCGVLTMDEAYRAIDWKTIFLVAGLLPLGLAMGKTGAAQWVASATLPFIARFGAVAVLGGLCIVSMLLTQAMSGPAVTAVVVPVALQAAGQMGLSGRALVMGVALSTSMAFLTPLGSPVNLLVMGQGGYRFRDYARVGAGLTLLLLLLVLLLLPRIWPLVAAG